MNGPGYHLATPQLSPPVKARDGGDWAELFRLKLAVTSGKRFECLWLARGYGASERHRSSLPHKHERRFEAVPVGDADRFLGRPTIQALDGQFRCIS